MSLKNALLLFSLNVPHKDFRELILYMCKSINVCWYTNHALRDYFVVYSMKKEIAWLLLKLMLPIKKEGCPEHIVNQT